MTPLGHDITSTSSVTPLQQWLSGLKMTFPWCEVWICTQIRYWRHSNLTCSRQASGAERKVMAETCVKNISPFSLACMVCVALSVFDMERNWTGVKLPEERVLLGLLCLTCMLAESVTSDECFMSYKLLACGLTGRFCFSRPFHAACRMLRKWQSLFLRRQIACDPPGCLLNTSHHYGHCSFTA